ncbi:MAG: UDP-N-acetylmuramoyl-tripeptide--D-alanyl-D-alanine ligase [Luminiphilus sp.]|nr:UDP-N-acetylmuramoyl-tripeptide--D-alanyl-D-alanine ligase [Luminiphilus sp.]
MIAPLSVTDFAARCGAERLRDVDNLLEVSGLAIDSRQVRPGDLFVAMPGIKVDGHDYLDAALERGAGAALVQQEVNSSLPQLIVGDAEAALQTFGAMTRAAYDGILIGITGSAGKTTAKNMLAEILSRAGKVVATKGNQNNELGVPLTLADLSADTEYAVLELGAGKPGDIARLCEMVRPNIAILLNVAPAHLANFGSLDAISETKGALLDDLPADGLAVVNADDPRVGDWQSRARPTRCLTFGVTSDADYQVIDLQLKGFSGSAFRLQTPEQAFEVTLNVPGRQGIYNALAAAAVADALGVSAIAIREGLAAVKPAPGRGGVAVLSQDVALIDDTYNANPVAVRAAIDVLASESGCRRLVLGAMLELGLDQEKLHAEIGNYAREVGLEELWAVGSEAAPAAAAFGEGARCFADASELIKYSPTLQGANTTVVKASRGAQLEVVVNHWLAGGEGIC